MSDCENRIAGARFFLDCARKTDRNQPEYRWYIQATASFAIAAIEILPYDYGEKNGLFPRSSRLWLDDMKRKFPNHSIFTWLQNKLEWDLPSAQKSTDGARYAFLRQERNSILHTGENDKEEIGGTLYFVGWRSEPCELVCENAIAFAEGIISEARKLGYL